MPAEPEIFIKILQFRMKMDEKRETLQGMKKLGPSDKWFGAGMKVEIEGGTSRIAR